MWSRLESQTCTHRQQLNGPISWLCQRCLVIENSHLWKTWAQAHTNSCLVGMMIVSGIEEGQECHLYYEVWTQSCPGMNCSRTYIHSAQSIEEDLWISIGTSTFEKGGWLIAFTFITQTIDVNVNIVASWTIIIVMHIIVTLKYGTLIVDCCRISKTMMTSIGEWRVGQTQHGAAKSMRNFVHSGEVMTEGIHFEHTIWALIIVPIALIHSEHVFA